MLLLGLLTWRQAHVYSDAETLWRTTIADNPRSWLGHTNLGALLGKAGREQEALAHLEQALALNPNVAETHNGLSATYLGTGRVEDAVTHARQALKIDPRNAEAHGNLGAALLQSGRVTEAISHLQESINLDPTYVEVQSNLGYAFAQVGKMTESVATLEKAIQLEHDYPQAHYNLANTFLHLGRTAEALGELQATFEIDPNDAEARNNAAWIMATSPDADIRNGAKALELAQSANELTGYRNPVIVATLAAAQASAGDFPAARKTAEQALDMAAESGNGALASDIRGQLEFYRSEKPFIDERGGRGRWSRSRITAVIR